LAWHFERELCVVWDHHKLGDR
jgi:hypothetical protein